jgi:predicted TIM-barrel fold metal-dependent hydrolase
MIDFHTHPLLVREMFEREPDLARIARDVFYIRNNPQPLETFLLELDVSGLDRAVLLPIDATTTKGCQIYSNELIAELCEMSERFIGFASVDPHRESAVADLEHAAKDLGLRGLKLSPPTQEFYPNDDELVYPLYEKAQSLGIPIVFHAGMSWEPGGKAKYGQPIYLEDVAYDFPDLNIVIAHFGWPWVLEAVMLALKYPNVYLDTSCLYFDNPKDFIAFVMTKQIPLSAIEKSLRHKVVFGSNYPRVEIKNMVKAVKSLGLSEGCLKLIFEGNARKLLGEVPE